MASSKGETLMKFKKLVKVLVLTIAIIFLVTSLTKKTEVYTIGVNIDRSGPSSVHSEEQIRSIELALNHFNVSGGFDGTFVKLSVKDNMSNKEKAIEIQKEFNHSDDVFATLSFASPEVEFFIYEISNDLGLPNIFMSIENQNTSNFGEQDLNYNYRIAATPSFQGFIAANYVETISKYSLVYSLSNVADPNSNDIQSVFKDRLESLRGKSVDFNERQINELLSELNNGTDYPDSIVMTSELKYNTDYITQIRSVNQTIPIITFAGSGNYSDKKQNNVSLENIMLIDHYSTKNKSLYSTDFENKFNVEPTKYAALSYDSTNFLLDSLVRSNTSEVSKLKESIDKTYHLGLLTGRISVDSYNNAYKSMVVRSFSKWYELSTITVFPE